MFIYYLFISDLFISDLFISDLFISDLFISDLFIYFLFIYLFIYLTTRATAQTICSVTSVSVCVFLIELWFQSRRGGNGTNISNTAKKGFPLILHPYFSMF